MGIRKKTKTGPLYIWESLFVVTVLADDLAPDSATLSADKMLTIKKSRFSMIVMGYDDI